MPFYAVARGRTPGIFNTWSDCEAQVKGYSGARYKKFDTAESAQNFIETEGGQRALQTSYKSSANNSNNTNYNLKRSYSTTSYNNQKKNNIIYNQNNKGKSKAKHESNDSYNDSNSFTDDSDDDLNTVITKQMDDIEKRLKGFEQGIDKIIKKNTVKNSNREAILIEPPQPKKQRTGNVGYNTDNDGYVHVYTDGACSSNGTQVARAGLGVYWGDDHPLNASEPVSGRATNNCGEIQAATRAIKDALQNGVKKLAINTDSQFLINAVTKWMPGWKRKGWKLQTGKPVKNEVDFKELDSVQKQIEIKWNYVEAHKGIHGNEMADQLAKAGASMYKK